MITAEEIYKQLRFLYPYEEPWDNNGILIGNPDKKITSVSIAIDPTFDIINLCNTDMLITHHPLIFNPIKKTNKLIHKLIQEDITYMALHTPLDYSDQANIVFCNYMDLNYNYFNTFKNGDGGQIGVIYQDRDDINNIANKYKAMCKLSKPLPLYNAKHISNIDIEIVGFIQGAANSFLNEIIESNIDLLVTGEISHHNIIELRDNDILVMLLGHTPSELFLKTALYDSLGSLDLNLDIEILADDSNNIFVGVK